ncbi:hypothetical protein B5E42_05295 [Flavonifractor sp. An10]|nr:hypothetical protein B5E42_05295 [Flavonifractor sp. An10]
MKGNRQGSLSRWIKQLFETSKKFQKVQQPVEKTFRQAETRRRRCGGSQPAYRSLRHRSSRDSRRTAT